MALDTNTPYFINVRDVVLLAKPTGKKAKNAVNHLIFGDYATYLGEQNGDWVRIRCRRNNGWVKETDLTTKRLLEINFVDIGQGDGCHIVTPNDEIILIDAGDGIGFDGKSGDNMSRFLNWRYNLRNRKVAGVDGVVTNDSGVRPPVNIDFTVISHPDLDHYYGFHNVFKNKKVKINKVFHNGIVERSTKDIDKKTWLYDLGRKAPSPTDNKSFYLWDTVLTNREMKKVLKENEKSRKLYLKTLLAAQDNNKDVSFHFTDVSKKHLDKFTVDNELTLKILSPITERIEFEGKTRECLKKIGTESETKNGHSLVFQLQYGHLKVLLGGDLNDKSQDYIAQHYSGETEKISFLEKKITKLNEKLANENNLSTNKRKTLLTDLENKNAKLALIVSKTKQEFRSDIAKACHHGASDVLDSFLQAINPIATIISSGDNESYSHPRPDALGAYGKAGRGKRPLIFSTELARSTKEFSYPIKFYLLLKRIEEQMNAATTKKDKKFHESRMNKLRDSNVAKYGMITIRTNGEHAIIAQKLEKSKGSSQKWDIYELHWNSKLKEFVYLS